jgi:hypothetical protein
MVVGGDGPEVGRGELRCLAFILEKANDTRGILQDLDDGVEEDAIEAGVIEADDLLMVLDEGVHGGPPDREWVSPSMIPGARFHMGILRGKAPCLVLQR